MSVRATGEGLGKTWTGLIAVSERLSFMMELCLLHCKTRYINEAVEVVCRQYKDDRPALIIKGRDGQVLCVATTNVPDVPLRKDEILIRNWGANEGVLDFLVDNGLVKRTNVKVLTGSAAADVVRVTSKFNFFCPGLRDIGK